MVKLPGLGYLQRKLFISKRGSKGIGINGRILVHQRTPILDFWCKPLTSTTYYQCKLFLLTHIRYALYFKYRLDFFTSPDGDRFVIKNSHINLFSFILNTRRGLLNRFKANIVSYYLCHSKIGSKITKLRDVFDNLKLYSVSFKSFSKIISYDRWSGFLTIALPSGCRQLFFYLSKHEPTNYNLFTGTSKLVFDSIHKIRWDKAGSGRLHGHKSKVRGVAKNPVDHPHGGRTKSIKLQRTPWGLPTKLK